MLSIVEIQNRSSLNSLYVFLNPLNFAKPYTVNLTFIVRDLDQSTGNLK